MKILRILKRSSVRQAIRKVSQASKDSEPKDFEDMPQSSFKDKGLYMPLVGPYRFDTNHLVALEKQKFGGVFRERFGEREIVLSFNIQDLAEIRKVSGPYQSKDEVDKFCISRSLRKQWYSTTELLLPDSQEWRELKAQQYSKGKRNRFCLADIHNISKDMVRQIAIKKSRHEETTDLIEELYNWSLESFACIGPERLGCLQLDLPEDSDAKKLIRAVHTQRHCLNSLIPLCGNNPLWKDLAAPVWQQFVSANDEIFQLLLKEILKITSSIKKRRPRQTFNYLFHKLLYTKDDPRHIFFEFMSKILNTMDRTALGMGVFLYNIAKNPEEQDIIYKEILKYIPTDNEALSGPVLNNLKYLRAAMRESERLNPFFHGYPRCLTKEIVLSGFRVPLGIPIIVLEQGIARNGQFFSNPDLFRPKRWLTPEIDSKAIRIYSQAPIGYSEKSCKGRKIIEQQMACLVIEIIRKFKIEYHKEKTNNELGVPSLPIIVDFKERCE